VPDGMAGPAPITGSNHQDAPNYSSHFLIRNTTPERFHAIQIGFDFCWRGGSGDGVDA